MATSALFPTLHLPAPTSTLPPPEHLRALTATLDAALHSHGLLFVTNLNLTPTDINHYFNITNQLFHQPPSEKATLSRASSLIDAHYTPLQTRALNNRRQPDLREAFSFPHPFHSPDPDFTGTPPSFRSFSRNIWTKLSPTIHRLSHLLALAADLPPDFFSRTLSNWDNCSISLNFYPPLAALPNVAPQNPLHKVPPPPAPLPVGEHVDWGIFTLLFSTSPGLQVNVNSSDATPRWVDVPVPPEGGAILNAGAMLHQWTKGWWRAVEHRVVWREADAMERLSLACFVMPDVETVVRPEGRFGGGVEDEAVTAGEFVKRKLREAEDEVDTWGHPQ